MSYESGELRPEIAVPLAPLRGAPRLLRRGVGLTRPDFARVRLATAGWAIVPLCLGLVGLLVQNLRTAALCVAVLLGVLLLTRAVMLVRFERLQHPYELSWLSDRTADLRQYDFPLLRFTVPSTTTPGPARAYDLSSGEQVAELLERRARDRTAGTVLEFACGGGRDALPALAAVRRDLSELEFLPGSTQMWVRFPEARYLPVPESGRYPARSAYWVLGGPVLVSGAEAATRSGSSAR